MIYFLLAFLLFSAVFLCLFYYSRCRARAIEEAFPPLGQIIKVDGLDVHFVDIPARSAHAPVVVFLHGASGNLRDPYYAFAGRLDTIMRQIFVDRPGHGWSERHAYMFTAFEQARHIERFLRQIGVEKAIFVGHSWGGALALTMAVHFPARVEALLLNAPVSHPWPGGINWYYPLAASPFFGWFFTHSLALPVGLRRLDCATRKVFWPNPVPDDYHHQVGPSLVLTPIRFFNNAADIAHLRAHIEKIAPHYRKISVPVTVITGDKDQVVLPWVHCDGLEKEIAGIRRIDLKEVGHMPHHGGQEVFRQALLELAAAVHGPDTAA